MKPPHRSHVAASRVMRSGVRDGLKDKLVKQVKRLEKMLVKKKELTQ